MVEITGTEATMVVPDPNPFDGEVRITRAATVNQLDRDPLWRTAPSSGTVAGRGTGVLDMARCLRTGGAPLAFGALAHHVLDAMIGMEESMDRDEVVTIDSSTEPVAMVDEDWDLHSATL